LQAETQSLGEAAASGATAHAAALERIDGLEARAAAAGDRIAGLDTATADLAEGVDVLRATLDEHEERIATVGKDLGALTDEQRADRAHRAERDLASATAAMKRALEAGGPFAQSLGVFSQALDVLASGSDAGALVDRIAPFEETGLPTAEALARQFERSAAQMRAAVAAGGGGATPSSALATLIESAEGLVSVDPVKPAAAADEDWLAPIAEAIAAGDLARVVAEWPELPAAAREAGAPLLAAVEARLAGERLVARAEAALADGVMLPSAHNSPDTD
jgi:hypothetical protein